MEEFKTLANSYGIEFSSDDEAKELFGQLIEGAKTLTKMVLSEAEMAGVSGGGMWGLYKYNTYDEKSNAKIESAISGAVVGALSALASGSSALLSGGVGAAIGLLLPDAVQRLRIKGRSVMSLIDKNVSSWGYERPNG